MASETRIFKSPYAYAYGRQVSLSEDAYERLKKAKKSSESFSDVNLRTVKTPSGDLERFFGAWRGKEYSRIEAKILADRKHSRSRDVHFD